MPCYVYTWQLYLQGDILSDVNKVNVIDRFQLKRQKNKNLTLRIDSKIEDVNMCALFKKNKTTCGIYQI